MQRGLNYLQLMEWIDKADKATGDLNKSYTLLKGKWGSLAASPCLLFKLGMTDIKLHGTITGGPFTIGTGRLDFDDYRPRED